VRWSCPRVLTGRMVTLLLSYGGSPWKRSRRRAFHGVSPPIESPERIVWPSDVTPAERFSYHRIEVSPDEQVFTVVANSSRGGELVVYRTGDRRIISQIGIGQGLTISDVRFSRLGERLAIVGRGGAGAEQAHRVFIVDRDLRALANFPPTLGTISAAFSGDDSYVVTGEVGEGWGRRSPFISRLTRAQLQSLDWRQLDANASSPPIKIRDAATGREIATIDAPDAAVTRVDWSPDSSLISAVLFDHSVVVWAWPSRIVVLRIRPAPSAAQSLCARFSPFAQRLAVCVGGSLIVLDIGETI